MRAVVLLPLLMAVASAKEYGKRELAGILRRAGMDGYRGVSLADWMCLIENESNYRTDVKGKNSDGSTDFGIFQINNRYWCDDPSYSRNGDGNGCGISCKELVKDDIQTAIRCAKTIVATHRTGIEAWVAWVRNCKGQNLSRYVQGI